MRTGLSVTCGFAEILSHAQERSSDDSVGPRAIIDDAKDTHSDFHAGIPWNATIFLTFGGLRGAISLILAQLLVTQQEPAEDVGVTAQVHQITNN